MSWFRHTSPIDGWWARVRRTGCSLSPPRGGPSNAIRDSAVEVGLPLAPASERRDAIMSKLAGCVVHQPRPCLDGGRRMTTTVTANGPAFRRRLTEGEISERELTRRTGLGPASPRSILLRNSVSGALARRHEEMSGRGGLDVGDLLDSPVGPAADTTTDGDVATLGALLNGAGRTTTADRLCRGLGWELDSLTRAGDLLDKSLRLIGQRLVRNRERLRHPTVGPVDQRSARTPPHQPRRRGRHAQRHGTRAVPGARGDFVQAGVKNDHPVQVAALLNRGAIQVGDAGDRATSRLTAPSTRSTSRRPST